MDTATEPAGARYGALGVVGPGRGTVTELSTSGAGDEARERVGRLPDGRAGVRLTVTDDGAAGNGRRGTTVTWQAAL
ncbi:hypothetical protein ACWDZ4_03095 [Streptomyces sp. NPDC003016]